MKIDANHSLIRSQKLARAIEFPAAAHLPETPVPVSAETIASNVVALRAAGAE